MRYRPSPELVAANAALVHQLRRQRLALTAEGRQRQSANEMETARAAGRGRPAGDEGGVTSPAVTDHRPRGQPGHGAKGIKPGRQTGEDEGK